MQWYSVANRIAGVLAARALAIYGCQAGELEDLRQEILLELWRKSPWFKAALASWPTFAEKIAANRLASLMRRIRASRAGFGRVDPIDGRDFPARYDDIDLQIDVRRVL